MRQRNIFLVMLLLITTTLWGQNNDEETNGNTFVPQIQRSERIVATPANSTLTIDTYRVETHDFTYSTSTEMETVSPLTYNVRRDQNDDYENLLIAGLGTRLSPLVLYRHHSDINNDMSFGAGVRHRSTWLDMSDYKPTKYMNNDLYGEFTGRLNLGQLRVLGDFHHDMYDVEKLTRRYNTLHLQGVLNSNGTGYNSVYDEVGAEYRFTGIPQSINEHFFKANGLITHSSQWFSDLAATQELTLGADLLLDKVDETYMMLVVKPSFQIKGDIFKVKVGLNFDAKTYDKLNLYPDISGDVSFLDKHLNVYAHIKGHTRMNTFYDVIQENPFMSDNSLCLLNSDNNLQYTKNTIDLRFGVRGRLNEHLEGGVAVRMQNFKSDLFFVNTYHDNTIPAVDPQTFSIVYGDMKVVSFVADTRFKVDEALSFSADLCFNSYDMDDSGDVYLQKAWYRPAFVMNLRCDYVFDEEWKFYGKTGIQTGRHALNNQLRDETLKPIVDVKIGGDYVLNDDFSLYAEIGNLLHDKYSLYYDKVSYGFELMMGLKYRF